MVLFYVDVYAQPYQYNSSSFTAGRPFPPSPLPSTPAVQDTEKGVIHIFPASSIRHCTGRVSAIRYCYYSRHMMQHIFTLLILTQLSKCQFIITNKTDVNSSTSYDQTRIKAGGGEYFCYCGTLLLRLSTTNLIFGIAETGSLRYYDVNVNDYSGQRHVHNLPEDQLSINDTLHNVTTYTPTVIVRRRTFEVRSCIRKHTISIALIKQ